MSLLQGVSALVMSCLVVYIIFREATHRQKIEELRDIVSEQNYKEIERERIIMQQKLEISRNLEKISKYELRIDELTAQTLNQNIRNVELNAEMNKALTLAQGVSEELQNEISRLRAEDARKTALLAKFNQK